MLIQAGHNLEYIMEYPFSFFLTSLNSLAISKMQEIKATAFSIALLFSKDGEKELNKKIEELS